MPFAVSKKKKKKEVKHCSFGLTRSPKFLKLWELCFALIYVTGI